MTRLSFGRMKSALILSALIALPPCIPAEAFSTPCVGCPEDYLYYSDTSMEHYSSDKLSSRLVDSDDPVTRRRAAVLLGARKEAGAVGALMDALNDENEYVRQSAAWAVCETDSKAAEEELLSALEQKDMPVVAGAYRYFIRKGLPGCENLLVKCLDEYGDATMAGEFIACGNLTLKNAGVRWASRKGMSVVPMINNKTGPVWGSGWTTSTGTR